MALEMLYMPLDMPLGVFSLQPALFAIGGFAAGAVLFFLGFRWTRLKRLIEDTPTSKIRSIAMGLVEVCGKVVPSEKKIMKSPLTGADCVYYQYTVQELRSTGKSATWVSVASGRDSIDFMLRDDTGTVLVNPKDAKVDIPADFSFQSGLGRDPPETVRAFLAGRGMGFGGLLGFNKSMKFAESYIAPNDKLYVMGTAASNPASKGSAEHAENIIIQKGENDRTFYISDRGERGALSSLKLKAWGGTMGGAVLMVGSLAATFIMLRLI